MCHIKPEQTSFLISQQTKGQKQVHRQLRTPRTPCSSVYTTLWSPLGECMHMHTQTYSLTGRSVVEMHGKAFFQKGLYDTRFIFLVPKPKQTVT